MNALENLPLEVNTEILSYLPVSDLARVCQVSRRMHAVSQRVLYTAPSLFTNRQNNPPSLENLLRTLIPPSGDPLAAQVRSLSVLFRHRSDVQELPFNMGLMTAAEERFQLPSAICSPDAHIVLLLHLLPRVQVLELGSPSDCRALNTFLEAPHAPVLQHLREFRHQPGGSFASISLRSFNALLCLPSLRTIDVRIPSSMFGDPRPTVKSELGTSTITAIYLRRSDLFDSRLKDILARPRALSIFSYSAQGFYTSLRSLALVSASLTHLHVDLSAHTRTAPRGQPASLMIDSLRDWPVLRTVHCSLLALVGWERDGAAPALADVLPVGLRDLEILDDQYWGVREKVAKVVDMLQAKVDKLPGLQRLAMPVGSAGDELRMASEAVGVLLVVRGWLEGVA